MTDAIELQMEFWLFKFHLKIPINTERKIRVEPNPRNQLVDMTEELQGSNKPVTKNNLEKKLG